MRVMISGLVIFLAALMVSSVTFAQSKSEPRKATPEMALPVALSYVKETNIFVMHPDPMITEDWGPSTRAADIALSPDGKSLAITIRAPKTGSKRLSPVRRIAIIDAKGAEPRVLESIPGDNSYGPIWSPDGKRLLVCCSKDGKWNVAVINKDGSGFKIITPSLTADPIIYPAFWDRDGKTVFAYDSSAIYQLGIDGNVLKRMPFSDWSIPLTSTGGKMALSPDGKRFLLETEVDSHERNNSLSSSAVVYVCDMMTKEVLKLTSRHGEISKPSWLPGEKGVVFSARKKN